MHLSVSVTGIFHKTWVTQVMCFMIFFTKLIYLYLLLIVLKPIVRMYLLFHRNHEKNFLSLVISVGTRQNNVSLDNQLYSLSSRLDSRRNPLFLNDRSSWVPLCNSTRCPQLLHIIWRVWFLSCRAWWVGTRTQNVRQSPLATTRTLMFESVVLDSLK